MKTTSHSIIRSWYGTTQNRFLKCGLNCLKISNGNNNFIKSKTFFLIIVNIRDNGGKVRLFTIVDVMGKGIHYTRIEPSSDQRLGVPKLGLKVRSHIDIDLNDANSQKLLRKVVKLTLSYMPPIGRGLYKKFGFVLSSLSTGNPICLLSGDRFLKMEEIYSIDYMTTDDDIIYDNIDITEFSGIFDIINANKKWQRYNKYYPYSLSNEDLELF